MAGATAGTIDEGSRKKNNGNPHTATRQGRVMLVIPIEAERAAGPWHLVTWVRTITAALLSDQHVLRGEDRSQKRRGALYEVRPIVPALPRSSGNTAYYVPGITYPGTT